MKFFKNQQGFNDLLTMTIIASILGALFITGIFVWKEVEVSKQNVFVIQQDQEIDEVDDESKYNGPIELKNNYNCYSFPPILGFPGKFRETNTVEQFQDFANSELRSYESELLNNFLLSEEFKKIQGKGEFYEMCFKSAYDLYFTMFGTFKIDDKSQATITIAGMYNSRSGKLITNDLDSVSLASRCAIMGFIGDDVLINCSWGDGGMGATKMYILDKDNEELKIIKDCTINIPIDDTEHIGLDEHLERCTVDIFDF